MQLLGGVGPGLGPPGFTGTTSFLVMLFIKTFLQGLHKELGRSYYKFFLGKEQEHIIMYKYSLMED